MCIMYIVCIIISQFFVHFSQNSWMFVGKSFYESFNHWETGILMFLKLKGTPVFQPAVFLFPNLLPAVDKFHFPRMRYFWFFFLAFSAFFPAYESQKSMQMGRFLETGDFWRNLKIFLKKWQKLLDYETVLGTYDFGVWLWEVETSLSVSFPLFRRIPLSNPKWSLRARCRRLRPSVWPCCLSLIRPVCIFGGSQPEIFPARSCPPPFRLLMPWSNTFLVASLFFFWKS